MTPDEVAGHPSVRAIRDPDCDLSVVLEYAATCRACLRRATARPGERAPSPCGNACTFLLVAPPEPEAWRTTALRGAMEAEADMARVPRRRLDPPLPPGDRLAWRARRDAVRELAPALAEAMAALPIGWAGLVELAAHGLAARGLGDVLRLRQAKEKFGTARLYTGAAAGAAEAEVAAARAVTDWAVAMSAFVCARDGTPDGRLGRIGGWWITLGARAWDEVRAAEAEGRDEPLALYPAWARPDA